MRQEIKESILIQLAEETGTADEGGFLSIVTRLEKQFFVRHSWTIQWNLSWVGCETSDIDHTITGSQARLREVVLDCDTDAVEGLFKTACIERLGGIDHHHGSLP